MKTLVALTLWVLLFILMLQGAAILIGILASFILKNFVWGYNLFQ